MITLRIKPEPPPFRADEGILQVPIELINAFLVNPLGSLRDYACIPTNAITPFFTDIDKLDAAIGGVNPFDSRTRKFSDDFVCKDEFFRYMHVDLAVKKDGIGISMCHIPYWTTVRRVIENKAEERFEEIEVTQPFIKYDFTGRILADGKSEMLISLAMDLILELQYQRNFYIHLVTFDRFESMQTVQTLREKGFNVGHMSIDRTAFKLVVNYDRDENIEKVTTDKQYNAAMECLRYAIQEERIEINPHEDWYQESRGLEYLADKDKVVKSPHSSDDLLQSIAGSAFNAANNELPEIDEHAKDLPEDVKDKKYEEENWNMQYAYNQDGLSKFSNYSVGPV
jgi:hypothetical protein